MVSGTELGTDLGVVLGARFLPVRSSTVTVEGVELVMRDLRWWTQSAARLSVRPRRDFVTREDPSPHPTAIPLPTVKEVSTGSLVVVVNLTPLVLAGAGVGLLARFLYLVERYWNVRLRLKLRRPSATVADRPSRC